MNIYQEKRRAQGHHCPCIGGSSKSASSTEDNRVTAGTIGISGSGNVVTDGGIVSRALDTVDLSNAIGLEGFTKLLDVGESLIGRTQTLVADAYSQASTDKDKTIDNRTIIVLAAAVVAALYVLNKRG
ncbi:hypothetical protein [Hydrogenophaga sp.]|uniref:hypothetical protein n=1 Tax=Hydrogenophaga sp. TaxID=1904254 RepID=UPI003D0DAA93